MIAMCTRAVVHRWLVCTKMATAPPFWFIVGRYAPKTEKFPDFGAVLVHGLFVSLFLRGGKCKPLN